jgi:NTE family protein
VLGGGGVVGGAYHAGALTALEQDLGWDARTADVIVGTSAGALVGALLRTDVRASDLAAWTVGAPLSPSGHALIDVLERPVFDPISLRMFLRPPRLPHPHAVFAAVRHPLRFDPMRALMTHLADGQRSLSQYVEFLGEDWRDDDLYICAIRRRDGRRVVFGRDVVPSHGVAAAVAASCAVPGYFAPVVVDGTEYIDGGVKSASNADVLGNRRLDLVIVVSPMTTALPRPRYTIDRVMRDRCQRDLRRELAMLRARGIPTVVLEPGAEVLTHVTRDLMNEEHVQEIVAAAFLETGQQMREPERAVALEGLAARTITSRREPQRDRAANDARTPHATTVRSRAALA